MRASPKATRRKSPRSSEGSSGGVVLPAKRSLEALAKAYGGAADEGARRLSIRRLAPVETAGPGDLAPLFARRYLAAAQRSGAALLVDASLAPLVPEGRRWVHAHAPYALALLLAAIEPSLAPKASPQRGRARAHIERGASVDPAAIIGPGAVILAGAVIGPGARIEPNAVLYGGAVIGARATIGAGSVIGRPGFRFVPSPDGALVRVPQLGGARIEDDAEIGPLCTVDAGTLAPTIVGRGAKLDAHVHVGHNAVIGAYAVVAAQAGFAGSVRIGAGALVGGQAGVADHVEVGDGAKLAAKSGVIGDVPPGAVVGGYPAVDRARWLRGVARMLQGDKKTPPTPERPVKRSPP